MIKVHNTRYTLQGGIRTTHIQLTHDTVELQLVAFIKLTTNNIIQKCFIVRKDLNYLIGKSFRFHIHVIFGRGGK